MKVYRSLESVPPDFGPSALTIGNFDGVHFGHRQILRRVVQVARERGWRASVLTFDPHPTRIVAPRRLGARAVLVGENFRFGRRQAGDVRLLGELGSRLGFLAEVIPTARCRGRTVSSSLIRQAIDAGRVALAARFLQHPYGLEGVVIKGHGVGAKQTVPTLNLETAAEVIPVRGVYLTRTRDLETDATWNSITNIGYRPTFGGDPQLSIETFLLEPLEGGPPQRIRVEFLCRVRDERKFETPEALRTQILKDVRVARNYFRRAKASIGPRLAPA